MMSNSGMTPNPAWTDLFSLAEKLIVQNTLEAKHSLLLSETEKYLQCRATLCWENSLIGNETIGLEDRPLIKESLITGKYTLGIDSTQITRLVDKQIIGKIRPNGKIFAVAAPIMVEDQIMGVLECDRSYGPAFCKQEIQWIDGLAIQAAIALYSSQMHMDPGFGERFSRVHSITSKIADILDLDDLFKAIVEQVKEEFKFPNVMIFTVHFGRKKAFYQAGSFEKIPDTIQKCGEAYINLDEPSRDLTRVINQKTSLLVEHISDDDPILAFMRAFNVLYIPLIYDDQILAILCILGEEKYSFHQQEISNLEILASNLSISIRNGYIYRSEQWRRKVADGMREVAGILTANTDLDQVLDVILSELEKALPCDVAAIWLISNEIEEEIDNKDIRLAAVHLSQDLILPPEVHHTPEELIEICNDVQLPNYWLYDAIQSSEPVIRLPDSAYEPLGAILDFPSDYSAIAAPLKLSGNLLGILLLNHHTAGRYGGEAQSMTATFASYAAVAIENTKLYEAAHDQAWVSTVLLQVADATKSLNTLEELLGTMVRITPMLIGFHSCSAFLWDEYTELFIPAATHGLSSEQEQYFYTWRVGLGDISVFDRVYFSRGPIFVDEEDLPEIIDSTISLEILTSYDLKTKSLALFPMVVHDKIIGLFLVDYERKSNKTLPLDRIDWEDKFAIIQGIAHQAAVSVQNIQLIKSQKEEAYISIALLQVAQAVVSLNALEEILESIVRITPILVGVKRCVIFLLDEEKNQFLLSQSYGIGKTELEMLSSSLDSASFPLLGAVQRTNHIAYVPLTNDIESPEDWPSIDLDDLVLSDVESGISQPVTADILHGSARLLYAFPLSVKNEVLGVMITQEPDKDFQPSFHLREKRQEITVGITQQAALAIQNDLLQHEVLARERLEREFQLAREIQLTFLPDVLPELEGWQLSARYIPAREVGGDFYDVFYLPDRRIGIVMADVADKGMPAALFMTVIRTLIRAIAKEEISPAKVLKKVNDLLVLDTKRGMFVTVAYAVLELNTGALIYANAGHNLPILVRDNRSMDKLSTTGMAMGVLEGIDILEKCITAEPGDRLLLYTDGITEAFSEGGEMFGEARLLDVILECADLEVNQFLNCIMDAVDEFCGSVFASDDITLFVISRLGAKRIDT